MPDHGVDVLFRPASIGGLRLKNRIVMAPMTRCFSPQGVPGPEVAAYYRRRAEGGVGLIITEGAWIPHPSASKDESIPRFYGEDALRGWKRVVEEVHAAGARIMPQLWHVGQAEAVELEGLYAQGKALQARQIGPSGMAGRMGQMPVLRGKPAAQAQIDAIIDAYALAALSAQRLGFDGVELHGAHGYLIDQFLWPVTNLREDRYGGSQASRARFACEVIAEIRHRTGPDFPIVIRLSQWKLQDYSARIAQDEAELAALLAPMAEAGVSAFHCSQRRFWEGEFGSDLNLAGWARKLTGLPAISVGSVSLDTDFVATLTGETSGSAGLDDLVYRMERGDFDLIAIGRSLIVNPDWPKAIASGSSGELIRYSAECLKTLA